MSTARVHKLNALLTRVQQRRHEPRWVSLGVGAPSANTNLAPPALELAKPAASIEEAIAPSAPSSIPPAAAPSSIPPPAAPLARTPPPPKPSTSTVPPSEHVARAPTEVLPVAEPSPAAPVRVGASPAVPFDSAVRVTSSPRIEAAKSFGELLELSLALRPKAG
jgi:hypothetical protein